MAGGEARRGGCTGVWMVPAETRRVGVAARAGEANEGLANLLYEKRRCFIAAAATSAEEDRALLL